MRISDWSSDVCSSDLHRPCRRRGDRSVSGWMQHLIVAPILLPLAVSGLLLAFDERRRALKRLVSLATVAALVGIAVMLLWLVTDGFGLDAASRSEEHTSELQSLMRISYAVFCLKKKTNTDAK